MKSDCLFYILSFLKDYLIKDTLIYFQNEELIFMNQKLETVKMGVSFHLLLPDDSNIVSR